MSILAGISEILKPENIIPALAGAAGAAAMAATDWRSPWRLIQHIFVGTLTSSVATPVFAPAISKMLGMIAVDASAHANASAFLVGAFGIYFFEFAKEFWKAKTKNAERQIRSDINRRTEDGTGYSQLPESSDDDQRN